MCASWGDSNQDVEAEVAAGRLLPDFVHLFAGRTINIPPLRNRPSEILPFARALLVELAGDVGRPVPQISSEAGVALESYDWPGNVRRLWMTMARALVLCTSDRIEPSHLGLPPSETRR
jgi:DNA-binding NtrC family response regulator